MKYLKLELELKEPLLAYTLAGDPNNVATLPFIPGSLLRGAAIARYLQRNPNVNLDRDPTARQLFLDGTVRYLNAYPAKGKRRLLPTPFSLHKEKRTPEPIYDLSARNPDDSDKAPDLERPVQIRQPFHGWEDGKVFFHEPKRQLTIHNRRDRVAGRATEKVGNVFRYEALAPGQTFIALILYPDNLADQVEALFSLGDILFLGLSRNAGYGKVRVTKVEPLPDTWLEGGKAAQAINAGETFSLLLLSDAILRDEHGHLTGFLTEEILERELGLQKKADQKALQLVHERTFSRSEIIGGFNRKWGMPLPQMWVARAGSVYTFKAKSDIPKDKLQALLEQGIGERRAEGFGRVALYTPIAGEIYVQESTNAASTTSSSAQTPTLSETNRKLAQRMAKRMLRRRLEYHLLARIHSLSIQGGAETIRNHQLSRIRTLIRRARLSGNDTSLVIDELEQMKQRARKQLEGAKVKDGDERQDLLTWLQAILKPAPLSKILSVPKDKTCLSIGDVHVCADETALVQEYALRLVDGLLGQTLAERRNEEKER